MNERQISERVNKLRKERNMTQTEFGRLVGLSERSVGDIERGRRSISVSAVANICNRAGVSADYLIFGKHDPMAAITALNDLTHEQIKIILDITMSFVEFMNTDTGNNALIQEVLRRYQPAAVTQMLC